jgi:hypothetical protein
VSTTIDPLHPSYRPAKHPWNKSVSKLVTDSWPMKLAFHSFEDHLAISDEYDSVRCVSSPSDCICPITAHPRSSPLAAFGIGAHADD